MVFSHISTALIFALFLNLNSLNFAYSVEPDDSFEVEISEFESQEQFERDSKELGELGPDPLDIKEPALLEHYILEEAITEERIAVEEKTIDELISELKALEGIEDDEGVAELVEEFDAEAKELAETTGEAEPKADEAALAEEPALAEGTLPVATKELVKEKPTSLEEMLAREAPDDEGLLSELEEILDEEVTEDRPSDLTEVVRELAQENAASKSSREIIEEKQEQQEAGKLASAPSPTAGLELGKANNQEIVSIIVEGNRLVLDDEVFETISSLEGEAFTREKVINDLQSIYNTGYFQKESIQARPIFTDSGVILRYAMKENIPITGIEIYGNEEIGDVDVYDTFKDLLGKPENIKLLSDKIRELELLYAKKGFILARVVDLDIDSNGILQLFLDEGIISNVAFTGNQKTKPRYLNKLVAHIKKGEPYNEQELAKDFKKINGTGYFSEVTRTLTPSETGNGYDVTLNLREKRTITLGIGGGVNTRSGLFGNINTNVGNIQGLGQRFTINGLLGSGFGANNSFDSNSRLFRRSRITQLNARYSVPYFRDKKDTLGYFGTFFSGTSFLIDLADQTNAGLGMDISRPLTNKSYAKLGGSFNLVSIDDETSRGEGPDDDYENFLTGAILDEERGFNIDRFDDDFSEIRSKVARQLLANGGCTRGVNCNRRAIGAINSARREAQAERDRQLEDGAYVRLRPSFGYSSLDDPFRPRKGWKTTADLEQALSFADFDSFTKFNASATKYFPVKKESSFLLNLRTGYNLFGNVPLFSQYRLGGFNGVRGYRPFSELGSGEDIITSTAEFRTPIYAAIPQLKKVKLLKKVDLAFFIDAGLVGGNSRLNKLSDRLSRALSVGFGLRVNLPLAGAIRADVGFPLVQVLGDDGRFFNFNFGLANRF